MKYDGSKVDLRGLSTKATVLKRMPIRLLDIIADSQNMNKLKPDFIKNYPDTKEETDPSFPAPIWPILQQIFHVDSDHVHNLVTYKYLTGLLDYVTSIPSIWMRKRQWIIASSTYTTEFSALRTTIEEAQSLRYMLRCLRCTVPSDETYPAYIFGDNSD